MKKHYLSFAMSALLSCGAALALPAAQDAAAAPQNHAEGEHRHMDPERQLQFLTKKLNLSSEQQTQLRPILAERAQQVEALRSDTSLAKEDKHEKMRTLHEESQSKIEAVLTAEQKKTYEQMQERSHAHHEGGEQK